MRLVWTVGFSLLGSVGAIFLAGLLLLFPEKTRRIFIPCLISYATGTLLGAAFLGLIPHALAHIPASPALGTVLIGVVLFFVDGTITLPLFVTGCQLSTPPILFSGRPCPSCMTVPLAASPT